MALLFASESELFGSLVMALFVTPIVLVAMFDSILHCINRTYNIIWALLWPLRLPFVVAAWLWTACKKKLAVRHPEERMHPHHLSEPWSIFLRGSRITTCGLINEFYWNNKRPDSGHILMAGVAFPVEVIANKLTLLAGISGCGKSTVMDLTLMDYARLMNVRQDETFINKAGVREQKGTRCILIDPDDSKYGLAHSCMASDVELFMFSPHHLDNCGWDIKADIGDSWELFTIFIEALFPHALRARTNDPFWIDNAIRVLTAIYRVYRHLGSDYRIEDFFIPLAFPPFLDALLGQTPQTKAIAEDTLKGRSGKDIAKTLQGRVSGLILAAGYMQKATTRVPLRHFLTSRKAVLHLGYSSNQKSALGQMYNVMLSMLVALTIETKHEGFNDLSYYFVDELPDLSDLAALDKVAKVGRKHGMGALAGALSIEALNSAWTETRTQELLSLVEYWLAFRSSLQTAKYFAELVGPYEGFVESYGKSTAKTEGTSESTGSSGNQGTYSYQVSTSYNWSNSTNIALTKREAVLTSDITGLAMPDVLRGRDYLTLYGWTGTTGLWKTILEGGFATTDFMQRRLTGQYLKPVLRPNADAELLPWSIEDLKRLKIKRTPSMMKAMSQT